MTCIELIGGGGGVVGGGGAIGGVGGVTGGVGGGGGSGGGVVGGIGGWLGQPVLRAIEEIVSLPTWLSLRSGSLFLKISHFPVKLAPSNTAAIMPAGICIEEALSFLTELLLKSWSSVVKFSQPPS